MKYGQQEYVYLGGIFLRDLFQTRPNDSQGII